MYLMGWKVDYLSVDLHRFTYDLSSSRNRIQYKCWIWIPAFAGMTTVTDKEHQKRTKCQNYFRYDPKLMVALAY